MPRWGLTVAGVAAIMVLAACSPSTPAPTPTVDPSTTTTPGTPTSSPGDGGGAASALNAYRGMWQAYLEAIRVPDPDYPDLARYAQGNALQVLVSGLTSVRDQGLVGVGDAVFNPQVIGARPVADPPQVEIEDCVDTSQSHLVKKDGSPYQDTPGGRRSVSATAVQLGDDTWKVADFAMRAVGTC